MTTQATDAAATIRKELERVKGKHHDHHGYCNECELNYPCDAARLAGLVETLVTALEFQRDYLSDCASDTDDNNIYGFSDVRDRIETALADAARELEGGSE